MDTVTVLRYKYRWQVGPNKEMHCVIGEMAVRKGIDITDVNIEANSATNDNILSKLPGLAKLRGALIEAYKLDDDKLLQLQMTNDRGDVDKLNEELKQFGITDFEVGQIQSLTSADWILS
jgi:hypothetical protein